MIQARVDESGWRGSATSDDGKAKVGPSKHLFSGEPLREVGAGDYGHCRRRESSTKYRAATVFVLAGSRSSSNLSHVVPFKLTA
jgi:hypothetical protein